MSREKPLPQRDGIDPVALQLPLAGESPEEAYRAQPRRPADALGASTLLGYMVARFYPHDRDIFAARFQAGEVVDEEGKPLPAHAPLQGQKIWYYRQLGQEKPVPRDLPILFEDEYILAVDKPHHLPSTPNGSYLAHTALTFLRVSQKNPLLVPIHRLDRPTAGVLVFAKTQAARAPFQLLFQNRQTRKIYEAIAPTLPQYPAGKTFELTTRIEQSHGQRTVTQLSPQEAKEVGKKPNATTLITPIQRFTSAGQDLTHYQLQPLTGKTHQLRAHLNYLGAPILNDPLYPQDQGYQDDNPHQPLQLLARTLSFTHPLTGQETSITSTRTLAHTPVTSHPEHQCKGTPIRVQSIPVHGQTSPTPPAATEPPGHLGAQATQARQ